MDSEVTIKPMTEDGRVIAVAPSRLAMELSPQELFFDAIENAEGKFEMVSPRGRLGHYTFIGTGMYEDQKWGIFRVYPEAEKFDTMEAVQNRAKDLRQASSVNGDVVAFKVAHYILTGEGQHSWS